MEIRGSTSSSPQSPSTSQPIEHSHDHRTQDIAPPITISKQTNPHYRQRRTSYNTSCDPLPPPAVSLSPPPTEPPSPPAPTSSSTSNLADLADDNIPSHQPRAPREPDRVPSPVTRPQAPPSDDEDGVDGFYNDEEQPPSTDDQTTLLLFREKWRSTFSQDSSWTDFTKHCTDFATAARELAIHLNRSSTSRNKPKPTDPKPTSSHRPPQGRHIKSFDPTEARRLQGLYYHSKKRAARKILENNNTIFTGTIDDAEHHFTTSFEEKHTNTTILEEHLRKFTPTARDDPTSDDLYAELRQAEIAAKLSSSVNTAPGMDKCEYSHLKKVDPTAAILHLIFTRCHHERDVPQPWKEAVTILIYKKGDDSDITNFRPIALMSTMYKLFMGVLAKRLTRWSIDTGILSDEQKSARPSEGCYEHTFMLKSIVADARRRKQKLCIAWLDLRNAFGSVSHQVIRSSLRHVGVPPDMVALIMNAYAGASTTILTPGGRTSSIPVHAGVKQGCPLSPIVFNLCLELILRSVKERARTQRAGVCKFQNRTVSCLAYADDLVFMARTPKTLQLLLDTAADSDSVLGFEFRPDKCATLFLTSDGRRRLWTDRHDFHLNGDHLLALENEQS